MPLFHKPKFLRKDKDRDRTSVDSDISASAPEQAEAASLWSKTVGLLEGTPDGVSSVATSEPWIKMPVSHSHQNGFAGGIHIRRESKPLNAWWGRKYGIAPSPSVTSRRPQEIAGGPQQNYEAIRKQCLAAGTLWEDPEFPATDETIFYSRRPPKPFEWKRPGELVDKPAFFSGGFSRFDVEQGELGDCWFLAAVATLTLVEELFYRVVYKDQTFDKDYCGVFHFQFWQYGHWVEVVVDDRLPTFNGRLVFMHSKDQNEFWSAILEKAYAKLNGSYEALKGGSTSEAMEDFTGGLTEMYDLKENPPPDLFKIIEKGKERLSMMSCSLEPNPNIVEAELPNGLICGHAYSVTDVQLVPLTLPSGKSGKVPLLRLRNPWGNASEWKGAWSDKSPEWQCISESERKTLGLIFDADGEFWISLQDFTKQFDKIEICHLDPDTADMLRGIKRKEKKRWVCDSFEGSWVRGCNAGGCRNYFDTFVHNPQYKITLADPDEGDDDDKCTCIVALLQKNRRKQRKAGSDNLTIGFAVYLVMDETLLDKPLTPEFFKTNASVARSASFINLREITCRFKFPPGHYVIVPSTFEPNQDGEFMLRVFSEKPHAARDLDEATGYNPTVEDHPIIAEERKKEDPLTDFFQKLAGEDLEIDAWELQSILTNALKKDFKFDQFSLDTCRALIALMDVSRSGTLDLEEFRVLWSNIRLWKAVFKEHNRDKQGGMSSFELRDAFSKFGYRLHSRVLKAMSLRYASKDGSISFDDFISCAVKLKTMIEIFNERDLKKTGKADFDLDAWVELTMYS